MSKAVASVWFRTAAAVGIALALISAAVGVGQTSTPRPKTPDVVFAMASPSEAPYALRTAVVTPAGLVAVAQAPSAPKGSGATGPALPAASELAADGIPTTALNAYVAAAAAERVVAPGCGIEWPLIAAIGRVESDHGRSGGALLYTNGYSSRPIIGVALNGHGTALVHDSDHGVLDGDTVYDHAVGPMQFIPSTWASYGVDANRDGRADPFNIFDAAAGAAHYLCAAGGGLTTIPGQTTAIRAYNDTTAYLTLVLSVESVYARGVAGLAVTAVPTVPSGALATAPRPHVPPADPGNPAGLGPQPQAAGRPPVPSATGATPPASANLTPLSGTVDSSTTPDLVPTSPAIPASTATPASGSATPTPAQSSPK